MPPTVDPARLAPILGDAAQWTLASRPPGFGEVKDVDGKPLLSASGSTLTLASQTALETNTEIQVRFRFQQQDKTPASVTLQTAVTDAANAKESGIQFGVVSKGDPTTVSWNTTNVSEGAGQKRAKNGIFTTGFTATRSLGWPDDVRRRVEADMAAAETVASHWFTMGIVLTPDKAEFFLDGIPLGQAGKPGLQTTGFARLLISPNVQVASVTTGKARPADAFGVYEPINLSPVLNADNVDGKKLDTAALAGAAEPVKAGGVPFRFAPANARGQNNVDIGASWVRQGNLEGRFSGNADPFGGRWAGALERDPARIQLRVPRGRYRALHLLAVADNDADSVPIVTAQFFRPETGFPVDFVSPQTPRLGAPGQSAAVPVKLAGGGSAALYHITVPLDPGALAAFDDQNYLELELTKAVQNYRAYPDPLFYSIHAAGLPSSVHVFAATLERPTLDVELTASAYGHVWTAPAKPSYTVALHNRAGAARTVELTLATTSYFGNKTTQQKQTVRLGAPGQDVSVKFNLEPPCYGYHDVKLTVTDGNETWDETRSLAYLHEETRERGDWEFGKGPMFGFWNWAGAHGTPSGAKQLLVMGQAGAETMHSSFDESKYDEEGLSIARKYKINSYKFAGSGDHYITGKFGGELVTLGLEVAQANFLKTLNARKPAADDLHRPWFLSFYAEPSIGTHTHAPPGDYYNAPDLPFTPAEEQRYRSFLNGFLQGAKIVKDNFPGTKTMLPHGDPNFPVPFLRRNPEIAKLLDGVTVDIPAFERLPEQQMHQVAIHRMYVSRSEFRKAGIEKPLYAMFEGPCLPTGPGALSQRELSDLSVRNALILLGYGVDFQTGGFPGFDCTSPWGEQHYGSGVLYRIPWEMPKPAFAAYATMTRQLNRCNFDGWTPTGSLSTYALRFRHYKTGKPVYALWTIRGTRPVTVGVPADAVVSVTDAMDNTTQLAAKGGTVSFTVSSSPVYVTGLPLDTKISLGDPDNSDAQPGATVTKLANLGDGAWQVSGEPDAGYENSHFPYIARFPGKMTIAPVAAPASAGSKALAIHLEQQPVERKVMPYYTTLVPPKPIVIPGKASHLGLWVKAASDWGRVIYSLRDAKGERWVSVGKAGAWNCDDLHSESSFNFDGWRYLSLELPANSPYDSFREAGSTWWGAYSSGDNIVDLPLSLDKVIVERRSQAMYVNDPQPTSTTDVLLGDLVAEYASPQDQGAASIRLAALRMPAPAGTPDLGNPIEKMAAANTGAPLRITEIKLPEQDSDGTQCYVFFDKHPDAVTYDIWASPYADGRGAMQLTKGWKEPGGLARGFRPETDFYLFAVYTNKDGKVSKPSEPFKIHLQDLFAQK